MTQKISPYKKSKIMALYLKGYSQTEIANKLKIDQSTVSLQISKFKSLVEQQGIDATAEEYGIMDQIESLHSLASELKKEQLTAEEAKVGLKMVSAFQKLGVKAEDYQDVIQAATKLKTEGFLESAVELNKLEKSSGLSHEEIVAQAATKHESLMKSQQDLEIVTGTLNASKEDLVAIENQKQLASQDLQTHMQQIGVDMKRLALVEELASTLKKAGVSNENLKDYFQRQQLLNEAKISIDIFVSILEKADVVTSKDHGEGLFQMLAEYGSLSDANKTLKAKTQLLEKETNNLEQKAKLRGEIEGKIVELKTEKAGLEAYVSELYDQKNTLNNIKSDISSLAEKKALLEHETATMDEHRTDLSNDIEAKQQKVSDLKDLELKHDAVLASLAEVELKEEREGMRWKMFESFLGFVGLSSFEELEKFVKELPHLLDEVKTGKYSPESLRNIMYKELIGNKLQLLQCISCNTKFSVDKPPPPYQGHKCPVCGLSVYVEVDKGGLAILKNVLAATKPQIIFPRLIKPGPKVPPTKDNGNG